MTSIKVEVSVGEVADTVRKMSPHELVAFLPMLGKVWTEKAHSLTNPRACAAFYTLADSTISAGCVLKGLEK